MKRVPSKYTVPESLAWIEAHPQAGWEEAKAAGLSFYSYSTALGVYRTRAGLRFPAGRGLRGKIMEYLKANPRATTEQVVAHFKCSPSSVHLARTQLALLSPTNGVTDHAPRALADPSLPAIRTSPNDLVTVARTLERLGVTELHFKDGEITATMRMTAKVDGP